MKAEKTRDRDKLVAELQADRKKKREKQKKAKKVILDTLEKIAEGRPVVAVAEVVKALLEARVKKRAKKQSAETLKKNRQGKRDTDLAARRQAEQTVTKTKEKKPDFAKLEEEEAQRRIDAFMAELEALGISVLKERAKTRGVMVGEKKKPELIAAIYEAETKL